MKSRSWHGSVKEGMPTFYVQAGNLLLETYATDDIRVETDSGISCLTLLKKCRHYNRPMIFWINTLRYPQMFKEYALKATFVEALSFLVRHRMHLILSSNNHAALQKLSFEATSLTKLQPAAQGGDTLNSYRSTPNARN